MRKNTTKLALAVLLPALALGAIFSPMSAMPALAATVSSPANASVNSDSFSGSSVALPPFVLTETQAGDIPQGTLNWTLPAGFLLDSGSVADVSYSGTGLSGSSTVNFVDSTHFSITINSTSTAAGSLTVGSVTPLKVKVSAGTPLASGNILLSSGSAEGITASTSFGTLTQVPGAATKLTFTVQPQSNAIVNTTLNAFQVSVQDQFGNTVTGDNGRAVSIVPIVVGSSTLGTLSGSTTISDSSGVAAFSGLSYNQTGTIQLRADAYGLTSSYSNNVVFTASGTPPVIPPCSFPTTRLLKNGILVKVAGSDTVYLVVNNTLRPFTTPAIFHAKGKKFQNIVVISQDTFNQLSIGRPVGEGRDDDDAVITIPFVCLASASASSTPPSLSNLPEGTVVKVPGDPTIYIVQNGQLHAIPSLSIFQAWKKNFSDVKEISQNQLQTMAIGQLANYPDGTLIQGSGQTVYVIKNGKKFGITSMNVLQKNGWSLKNKIRVNEQERTRLEDGGVED